MRKPLSVRPSAAPGLSTRDDSPALRPMLHFAGAAITIGGSLLALSTVVEPGAPFILAAVLLGLLVPALTITHRETGPEGVRRLLRDAVRIPRRWWWLPVAGFALPVLSWAIAAPLGGAQPASWSLATFYVLDLLVGAVVINIWEELAWTGCFQRRAMARWRPLTGSLVTAAFFTGIHVPLAFDGASSADDVVGAVLLVGCVAVGLRLLIARVDGWADRSLLTIGLLHSAFNASESVLLAEYDWVRLVVTVTAGLAAAALTADRRAAGSTAARAVKPAG